MSKSGTFELIPSVNFELSKLTIDNSVLGIQTNNIDFYRDFFLKFNNLINISDLQKFHDLDPENHSANVEFYNTFKMSYSIFYIEQAYNGQQEAGQFATISYYFVALSLTSYGKIAAELFTEFIIRNKINFNGYIKPKFAYTEDHKFPMYTYKYNEEDEVIFIIKPSDYIIKP